MVDITREEVIEFCLIDPFCGAEDIEKKLIRAVGHPKQRFKEDPLRILRAIRFSCRFGFEIEEATEKKLKKMGIHLLEISKERWMIELDKILLSQYASYGLSLLWENELFKWMIPEMQLQYKYDQNSEYHDFQLHIHTKKVVDACPKELNLRWSALLHDIAKPFVRTDRLVVYPDMPDLVKSNYVGHEILGEDMVKKIATHLKWSKERTESVVSLVKNHLKEDCPLREYDNIGKVKTNG